MFNRYNMVDKFQHRQAWYAIDQQNHQTVPGRNDFLYMTLYVYTKSNRFYCYMKMKVLGLIFIFERD